MFTTSVTYVFLLLLLLLMSCTNATEWVYEQQFPEGSENLPAPNICLFSIYMGKIKYEHMPLL